jgi:alanyl-tRNA synthetase
MDIMELNEHNKQEFAPMHSAEHILNGTMVKMIGCRRADNAHIERKKSKCDYILSQALTPEQVQQIEDKVNEVINQDLSITVEYATQDEVRGRFDLARLPEGASETVRIVHIGDYDECLCVGAHVERTSQIGKFRISSTRYQNGVQRIVFRLDLPKT